MTDPILKRHLPKKQDIMNKDRKIDIMGIVNLTDDSYFAESRCADPSMSLRRAHGLIGRFIVNDISAGYNRT